MRQKGILQIRKPDKKKINTERLQKETTNKVVRNRQDDIPQEQKSLRVNLKLHQ